MTATISIITLFPELVSAVTGSSILRRAQAADLVRIEVRNLRDFATNGHRSVDDKVFGSQAGMLFLPDVVDRSFESELARVDGDRSRLCVVYPSPRGVRFAQSVAEGLSQFLLGPRQEFDSLTESGDGHGKNLGRRIVVLCGRYEGVDDRVLRKWVDLELSLGDFVLSGGEIPALAICDSVVRLLPGVLGDERSAREDSFSDGLIEQPHYTGSRDFARQTVPQALISGNHALAAQWRLRESLLTTFAFRPDLIARHDGRGLPEWARALLTDLQSRLELRT